ncbi:hypothetical protein [Halorussus caseinilyticus]|uniref:Uncharacterized protein n=1 Tax=Halorussus caseinilyticus TaxID=3034025 RepID=A0ABD5WWD2_9EURY|nr:hypothetical protein [Halorussus sp. DT72]
MPEYKAFSSEAEVNGRSVQSIVEGVGQFSSAYKERALEILANHGLPEPTEGEWYSMQSYLDAFAELVDTVGPKTVTKIGSEIPNVVEWPEDVETVEDGMHALDDVYQMNHRGGEIGYYEFERTGDSGGIMECKNPYPPELDEGLIQAVAEKFSGEGAFVRIEQTSEGETRTYQISW